MVPLQELCVTLNLDYDFLFFFFFLLGRAFNYSDSFFFGLEFGSVSFFCFGVSILICINKYMRASGTR